MVAKGYTLQYGSDYYDVFFSNDQDFLYSFGSFYGCYALMALFQLDINNAFPYGDLAEKVYMEQLPGFVAQGESGLVCKLRCSLYGMKQSSRAWFSQFSSMV